MVRWVCYLVLVGLFVATSSLWASEPEEGISAARVLALLDEAIEDGGFDQAQLRAKADAFYPLLKRFAADVNQPPARRAAAFGGLADIRHQVDSTKFDVQEELIRLGRAGILEDQPSQVRGAAGLVLVILHKKEDAVYEGMIAGVGAPGLATHRREYVRYLARDRYGPAFAVLVDAIRRTDRDILGSVLEDLHRFGDRAGEAVPAIVALQLDPERDADFIVGQQKALGEIAALPKVAVPKLIETFDRKELTSAARGTALESLAWIAVKHELDVTEILPRLGQSLVADDIVLAGHGLEAVRLLGPRADRLVEKILPLLQSEDDAVREAAARALGAIGPGAVAAVPALIDAALRWKNPHTAAKALRDIGKLTPELIEAMPQLVKEWKTRGHALQLLTWAGEEAATTVGVVAHLLPTADELLTKELLKCFKELGEHAVAAIPDLAAVAIRTEDSSLQRDILSTMRGIDPKNSEVRATFLAVMDVDYYYDRNQFIELLGDEAPELLMECLEHGRPVVRRNAVYMLLHLDLSGDKVLPIYRKGFKDSDLTVRVAAAVGMFRAGERIPAVIELLVGTVATEQFNDVVKETIRRNKLYFNELLALRIIDPESSDQVVYDALELLPDDYATAGLSAAFHPLREALHSENRTIQVRAAMALTKLRYDTPSVADVLAEEIENAGPMRDQVLNAVEKSHLNSRRLNDSILDLTRSEDPGLVKRGFLLARGKQLAERHAEELAEHLLSESRFLMAVAVLERSNQKVPFKAEYVPPLKRLIFQGREISPMGIGVLLNMGEQGLKEALELFDEPDLPDSMRIILIQKIALHVRDFSDDDPLRGALDRVAENLNHENPWVTTRTAIALLEAGYDQDPLIPFLLRGYASQNREISGACYGALFWDSQEDDAVVAFLLKRLENAKPKERKSIVELLNSIGSHSPAVVDVVVEYLLNDLDDFDRQQFAYEIKEPIAERLMEFFEEGTIEKRRMAMETVRDALENAKGSYGNEWNEVEGKTSPPGVLAAVSAEDEGLRFAAAMLLLQYHPTAEEALPVLREAFISDDIEVRLEALRVLPPFGPAAAPLMPELLAVLRSDKIESEYIFTPDPNITQRNLVLSVLQRIGPAAAPALPDLIELLDDPEIGARQVDWNGHSGVPAVLAAIGEASKPAEPFLIEMLPEAESLTPIGQALKNMGGSTAELIAEIDRRLDDPVLCYQAVKDLQVICDIEPITPRLIKILSSDNLLLKRDVAEMLAGEGLVRDPVLVPLLLELLEEEFARVRAKAIGALAAHHVPVGVLIERLKNDERVEVRSAVVESLAAYADRLLQWNPHYASRMSKAEMYRLAQRVEEPVLSALAAIPVLEEALREPHGQENSAEYFKIKAAYTLAKFGETAKRSLPLLLELRSKLRESDERGKYGVWGVERWENALLTAIWSIDLETAIENELPRPQPRRDW